MADETYRRYHSGRYGELQKAEEDAFEDFKRTKKALQPDYAATQADSASSGNAPKSRATLIEEHGQAKARLKKAIKDTDTYKGP